MAAAGEGKTEAKWEGKARAEVKGATPEQVWPFLADFCNLHKWLPTIQICYGVEGAPGEPGLVRYCASHDGDDAKWAKERLLTIDPANTSLSYETLDNNMGLGSYVATIRALPLPTQMDGKRACEIEWSFVCDPVRGWTLQDLSSYVESGVRGIAETMANALLSAK